MTASLGVIHLAAPLSGVPGSSGTSTNATPASRQSVPARSSRSSTGCRGTSRIPRTACRNRFTLNAAQSLRSAAVSPSRSQVANAGRLPSKLGENR